jgi:hypothetical protein
MIAAAEGKESLQGCRYYGAIPASIFKTTTLTNRQTENPPSLVLTKAHIVDLFSKVNDGRDTDCHNDVEQAQRHSHLDACEPLNDYHAALFDFR